MRKEMTKFTHGRLQFSLVLVAQYLEQVAHNLYFSMARKWLETWTQALCLAGACQGKDVCRHPVWVPAIPVGAGSPRSLSVWVLLMENCCCMCCFSSNREVEIVPLFCKVVLSLLKWVCVDGEEQQCAKWRLEGKRRRCRPDWSQLSDLSVRLQWIL